MADQQTTANASGWGWNGDLCAVWGEAIVIGESRAEKEERARLFAAASEMLETLRFFANPSTTDDAAWRKAKERAQTVIAKAEGKQQ